MKVFVIIDGLGDLGVPALKGKTPLEAARIPNLDWFAKNGKLGYHYPIREGIAPESDGAIMALLGNDTEKVHTGRGPIEAYGAGLRLRNGDLALRTNFATIKDGWVIDRRAGRGLTTNEAKILEKVINAKVKLSNDFLYKSTVQHRGILIIKGRLSAEISNIDPEYTRLGKIGVAGKHTSEIKKCKPLYANAKKSAELVNHFFEQVTEILNKHPLNIQRIKKGMLPANALLLRDAGIKLPKIKKLRNWFAVPSMPLEIGLANLSGMKVLDFAYPEMRTKNAYNNLYEGLKKTIKMSKIAINRKKYAYYIHFKEVDVCGHDGDYKNKVKMLEIIDKVFFSFLRNKELELIVTGDHSTPCIVRGHSSDPVPVLLFGKGKDKTERFCEKEARKGSLCKMYGKDVLKLL